MSENHNNMTGAYYEKQVKERKDAQRRLQDMKKRERQTYLRYVLMFDTAEIHTNNPEMWLEQGARIIREVHPNGDEKRRRGRPRKS